jgi:hypothetical protein
VEVPEKNGIFVEKKVPSSAGFLSEIDKRS